MAKPKKTPTIDLKKIREFDKLIPEKEIGQYFEDEFVDIYNSIKNPQTKLAKQLKKYFIIRMVTTTEAYLQHMVAALIDEYDLDVNNLYQEGEIRIPLKNFKEIQKKDFTKGKIVAGNFNFQNPEEINSVFSRLLGINFLDSLKEYAVLTYSKEDLKEASHLLDYWENFLEMFSLRNEIVHTLRTPHKIRKKAEYFINLLDCTFHFLNLTYIISFDIMEFDKGKLKDKDYKSFFSRKIKEYRG